MTCRLNRITASTFTAYHPRPSQHTLLPFLYQTATIQKRRILISSQSLEPDVEESVKATPPSIRRVLDSKEDRSQRTQARSSAPRPPQYDRQERSHDCGFTASRPLSRSPGDEDDSPGDLQPQHDVSSIEIEAADDEAAEQNRIRGRKESSTMTDVERKAFKRLFDSLNKGQPLDRSHKTEQGQSGQSDEDLLCRLEDDELDDIEAESAESFRNIGDFPAELHGMASRAQSQLARHEHRQRAAQRLQEQGKDYDPVIAAQRQEFRRIETALHKAETDIAVWQILSKDVFPKLTILEQRRLEAQAAEVKAQAVALGVKNQSRKKVRNTNMDSISHVGKKMAKNIAKSKQEAEAKAEQDEKKAEESKKKAQERDQAPTLPAHSFQHLFLLAMRLLSRRTTYTPLATSLLPIIKSHSLTSSILGTSTSLYNEVLAHRWEIHNEIGTLLSLLREMDSSGVPANRRTLEILDGVSLYRYNAQKGQYGLAIQAMEKMLGRQAEAEDMQRYRKVIRRKLETQALERSRTLEVERSILADSSEEVDGGRAGLTSLAAATG